MAFTDDLKSEVGGILAAAWSTREGRQVPDTTSIRLGNDAVTLNGTVLYADLAESTNLVTRFKPEFVAKVYKCYLNVACRIIRQKNGEITAFDGDRVMAVFLGDMRSTNAARAALAIAHAVRHVVNPALRDNFKDLPADFAIKQAVGLDESALFIARTGIRNANDLVWVGRAANYAAKLCSLRDGDYGTWITKAVYDRMDATVKTSADGRPMWEARTWTAYSESVFRSNWSWQL